jgi:hexosaminidase
MKRAIILVICFITLSVSAQTKLSIIPLPKTVQENKGNFKLDEHTLISYNQPGLKKLAEFARAAISEAASVKPVVTGLSATKKKRNIFLLLDPSITTNAEGYILDVTPQGISIKANAEHGLFYGLQTLMQLIPVAGDNKIPAVHIEDEPRFSWRGMMMDVCRHQWSVDFIKRFIDQLAYHKLNKFHWHLTEDQGWRVEIKKYPKLQEISAFRNGTQVGYNFKKDDGIRYGGYYTQEQIKEVVAYAESRYVEVIPEIEMPGHSVAAITAYPHLACNPLSFETGKPHEVRKVWGVSKDIFCAGNDSVFVFLQDVLTEVMPLFPSKFIHIGGDEAPHEAWAQCPKCQKRMKDEGLKNEAELQSWFIRRMEKFINAKGKRIIGWEEIMDGGLSPTATVHSWLGTKSGIKASQMGNDVIMSPNSHLYFDGYQADQSIEPMAAGWLFTPLEKVYAFEPRDPQMSDADAKHLLGAQANVWTEYITTEKYFDYMVYPRMDALAEMTWTPKEQKNFAPFEDRLKTQLIRYDQKNINYRIPTPHLQVSYGADSVATITLTNRTVNGVIRYEIDKEKVTAASPVYDKPVSLNKGSVLRFSTFIINDRQSSIDYFPKMPKKK